MQGPVMPMGDLVPNTGPFGTDPEARMTVSCSAVSFPPNDADSHIDIGRNGRIPSSEHYDRIVMNLRSRILHSTTTFDVQPICLKACMAWLSELPHTLGDPTPWIQYLATKRMRS
jgi:hypothetical protein